MYKSAHDSCINCGTTGNVIATAKTRWKSAGKSLYRTLLFVASVKSAVVILSVLTQASPAQIVPSSPTSVPLSRQIKGESLRFLRDRSGVTFVVSNMLLVIMMCAILSGLAFGFLTRHAQGRL